MGNIVITSKLYEKNEYYTVTGEDGMIKKIDKNTEGAKLNVNYVQQMTIPSVDIPVTYDEKIGRFCITNENVDSFIECISSQTINKRTTLVCVTLKNGYTLYETSTAATVEGYDEKIGTEIALNKIKDKIFELLGFALLCVQPTIPAAPYSNQPSLTYQNKNKEIEFEYPRINEEPTNVKIVDKDDKNVVYEFSCGRVDSKEVNKTAKELLDAYKKEED